MAVNFFFFFGGGLFSDKVWIDFLKERWRLSWSRLEDATCCFGVDKLIPVLLANISHKFVDADMSNQAFVG